MSKEGLVFGGKMATFAGKFAMNLGIGLTIMGVSEMLFPLPKPKNLSQNKIHNYHLVFLELKTHQGLVLPFQ